MKKIYLASTLVLLLTAPVYAQTVTPLDTPAKQAYLVDMETGTPLFTKEADTPMPPSSMSKMMTLYMVFDALKNGKLKKDETLPISEHAWRQEGSRMFAPLGACAAHNGRCRVEADGACVAG